jgi:hypothetical protein
VKTPEETLKQWTCDDLRFKGGGSQANEQKSKWDRWTRQGLNVFAEILNAAPGMGSIAYLNDKMTQILQRFRTGGPPLTAQFLAQFDSLQEVVDYYRKNQWLDEIGIDMHALNKLVGREVD